MHFNSLAVLTLYPKRHTTDQGVTKHNGKNEISKKSLFIMWIQNRLSAGRLKAIYSNCLLLVALGDHTYAPHTFISAEKSRNIFYLLAIRMRSHKDILQRTKLRHVSMQLMVFNVVLFLTGSYLVGQK